MAAIIAGESIGPSSIGWQEETKPVFKWAKTEYAQTDIKFNSKNSFCSEVLIQSTDIGVKLQTTTPTMEIYASFFAYLRHKNEIAVGFLAQNGT
ncbi:hypothetical protein [Aeromonas allosaccharophila]|uniref:hypothetical protein n=1 Tax=Aeromonas allosaccharophila TaxID=656 RepID=UPI0018CD3C90|nr:hypothetical protein [Aeromonas allosaccharophila]